MSLISLELCKSQKWESNIAKTMVPLGDQQLIPGHATVVGDWVCVSSFPPPISAPVDREKAPAGASFPLSLPPHESESPMGINKIMILKLLASWCKLVYKSLGT